MQQGNEFSFADLASELSELTREANRANTTIYTIDPRGLVGMPDLDEKVDMMDWQNYVTDVAEQPARPRGADRRLRDDQPERLHEGAEADRRGDERLLRHRLLLVQPRSDAAQAEGRSQGQPAEHRPALPHRVHAEADESAAAERASRTKKQQSPQALFKTKGRPA